MPAGLSPTYVLVGLLVIGVITVLLRLVPFVALSPLQDSRLVRFLGIYMPGGVMVILVIYTLRETTGAISSWVPAACGMAVVISLHLWKRSSVLSILVGTAVYVALATALG
ncbi:branched-chain amino acid transporter permease [Dietzia sp.]|uniref:branched-chain amino acid transporter permease n=1 Tax=Dietzia sp. TaxID=1871616 RepID=UPI002FD8CEED